MVKPFGSLGWLSDSCDTQLIRPKVVARCHDRRVAKVKTITVRSYVRRAYADSTVWIIVDDVRQLASDCALRLSRFVGQVGYAASSGACC